MYAMLGTCPDIGFTITHLSQYSSNPGEEHWIAINCLLCYLNTTKETKLVYDGNSDLDNESRYSDSDWAGDPRDYHSVSGFIFIMGGAAISWSLKKQSSITLSSTEREYMSIAHSTNKTI